MPNIGDGRPVRFCPLCQQADDHPRHEIAGTVNNVAPHMDCCAAFGCPDGSCPVLTRDKGRKVGAAFLAQIRDNQDETQRLLEERPAEVRHFTVADVDTNVHGGFVGTVQAGGAQ